jgi:glycosyltransferase involved in cell wall biosynthesis
VIPTYNRSSRLRQTVEPLLRDDATGEVVVVVDDSDDGSVELLEEMAAADPRVRPLFVEKQGAMRARASGVETARGSVVVLLDDDVIAEPGLVSGHLSRQKDAKGLVVVGYMPLDPPPADRPADPAAQIYSGEYEQSCARWETDPDSILKTLWGGNISMRRTDFLRVADTGELMVGNHGDMDFGLRCLKAGFQGRFDRSLRARHAYHRPLPGFLLDAYGSGHNRWLIRQKHRDVLGDQPPDWWERDLPWPGRLLMRAARARRVAAALVAACGLSARLAGALRLYGMQRFAVRVGRHIEGQRGQLDAARE